MLPFQLVSEHLELVIYKGNVKKITARMNMTSGQTCLPQRSMMQQ
jgi:hypothetical protein